MNSAFREYATSSAFTLTLSKSQIEALGLVVERGSLRLTSGVGVNGLLRRGLVERTSTTKQKGDCVITEWWFGPTLTGKLVYQLLVEAGMFEEQGAATEVLIGLLEEGTTP